MGGVAFKCFTSMNTLRHLPRLMEKATLYTHLTCAGGCAGPVRVYDTGGAQLL